LIIVYFMNTEGSTITACAKNTSFVSFIARYHSSKKGRDGLFAIRT